MLPPVRARAQNGTTARDLAQYKRQTECVALLDGVQGTAAGYSSVAVRATVIIIVAIIVAIALNFGQRAG